MSVMSKFGPNQRDFLSEMVINNITFILNFSYDLIIKGYKSRGDLLSGLSKQFNCISHNFVSISVVISVSRGVRRIFGGKVQVERKSLRRIIA